MRAVAGVLFACLSASCASRLAPPAAPPAGLDRASAVSAYARVLERHVDDEGWLDFAGIGAERGDLERFLAWIAETGPGVDPGGELEGEPWRELAFWIDAYNALAIRGVLDAGVVPSQKLRFFVLREQRVAGRWISLYDLENDVIRPLGEERVHFALNCMVRSCPRLPREPFLAARSMEDFDARLRAATREFLLDPRHAAVDGDGQGERPPALILSKILEWYEDDFLLRAPSLAAYVSEVWAREDPARPALPTGDVRVRFADYDWRLKDAAAKDLRAAP